MGKESESGKASGGMGGAIRRRMALSALRSAFRYGDLDTALAVASGPDLGGVGNARLGEPGDTVTVRLSPMRDAKVTLSREGGFDTTTLIGLSAACGMEKWVESFAKAGAAEGLPMALVLACSTGSRNAAAKLIELGADPFGGESFPRGRLGFSAGAAGGDRELAPFDALSAAAAAGSVGTVKMLIARAEELDAKFPGRSGWNMRRRFGAILVKASQEGVEQAWRDNLASAEEVGEVLARAAERFALREAECASAEKFLTACHEGWLANAREALDNAPNPAGVVARSMDKWAPADPREQVGPIELRPGYESWLARECERERTRKALWIELLVSSAPWPEDELASAMEAAVKCPEPDGSKAVAAIVAAGFDPWKPRWAASALGLPEARLGMSDCGAALLDALGMAVGLGSQGAAKALGEAAGRADAGDPRIGRSLADADMLAKEMGGHPALSEAARRAMGFSLLAAQIGHEKAARDGREAPKAEEAAAAEGELGAREAQEPEQQAKPPAPIPSSPFEELVFRELAELRAEVARLKEREAEREGESRRRRSPRLEQIAARRPDKTPSLASRLFGWREQEPAGGAAGPEQPRPESPRRR